MPTKLAPPRISTYKRPFTHEGNSLVFNFIMPLYIILASHASLDYSYLSHFRLLSPLHTQVTHGFLLEIKTETRGCLEINIYRFIVDDNMGKYTKKANKRGP